MLTRTIGAFIAASGAVLLVFPHAASAVTANDYGNRAVDADEVIPCYKLSEIVFDTSGYVSLTFSYDNIVPGYASLKLNCKHEVYNGETLPENKIRGVQGIDGQQAEDTFTILVEPDTVAVVLELAGEDGMLSQRS